MHGQGTFNWPGGEQFVGEFRNGKRQGQGRYLTGAEAEEVEYYQGEWNQDRYHGKGIFVWKDGSRYEGDFNEGKIEGRGTYQWSNGVQYS